MPPKYRTLIDGHILTREAAALLGLSATSNRVNQLAHAGKLGYRMRDGKTIEVNLRDVLRLAATERKPGQPKRQKEDQA